MDARKAKEQFEENLRLFAPADREPEKFNLYAGLANLASEIESLRLEVRRIRQVVESLQRG